MTGAHLNGAARRDRLLAGTFTHRLKVRKKKRKTSCRTSAELKSSKWQNSGDRSRTPPCACARNTRGRATTLRGHAPLTSRPTLLSSCTVLNMASWHVTDGVARARHSQSCPTPKPIPTARGARARTGTRTYTPRKHTHTHTPNDAN